MPEALLPIVDPDTFEKIVEEDGDGQTQISRVCVEAYNFKAKDILKNLDEALIDKDLSKLWQWGGSLKESSEAIGASRVAAAGQKIQKYCDLRDDENDRYLNEEEALHMIEIIIEEAKVEYDMADKWFQAFYEEYPDSD